MAGCHSLSRCTMLSNESLAGKRIEGVHHVLAVEATCEDMCQGLIEATVAIFLRRNTLTFAPDHSCPRANEATICNHSGSLKRKKPGWPLLPDVAVTQYL